MTVRRRSSFNDPGHAHFVTFGCYHHQQLLTDESTCVLLASSLDRARAKLEFDLWAYVFMPEHVHLLISPRPDEYSIPEILSYVKGPFAKSLLERWRIEHPTRLHRLQVKAISGAKYRIWQRGGGYDRNLHKWDTVKRVLEYIEYNPVRRGLVSVPEEWRWSSAGARAGRQDVPIEVDEVS